MEIDRRLFLFTFTVPLYAAAPLQTFSPAEARLVEALCDQIIPSDEFPGAKDAGVLYYLDQQLAGPLKRFAAHYRASLPVFATACRQKTNRAFEDLSFEDRTRFLLHLEKEGSLDLKSFFRLITEQTMQGYYGAPSHGGNRDEASWKMLGVQNVMKGHSH